MSKSALWVGVFALGIFFSCQDPGPLPETADSPARAPEEELRTFQIDKGLEVQLVASEPMVEAPVMIQFDADGRLWVVEMKGYMTDIEGSEEKLPTGTIAILEDTDGDGMMDKRTVYLDSLVMPRSLGFFKNGALVAENNALWWTEDQDGDGRADVKTLVDSTYAANGLPEHADNGFLRGVDNWYYSAKSKLRYKPKNGVWIRDLTEFRGQWGINQDDKGRLIYNYNWSQLHGDLVPPNYLSRNKNYKPTTGIDYSYTSERRVYPIRSTPAVNRGYIPGTLDSANRLVEFTSAGSPTIYRAHLLPQEYYGNVFVTESAGNLVKRNVLKDVGNLVDAKDPNPGREFFASTDERFRPVNAAVGPDGALYIVDMYIGIIQHSAYMTPYLREKTLERGLDGPSQLGRIWRVVPKGYKNKAFPKLSQASTTELITFLSHQDGWYRDVAQRLLVEKNDPKSISALEDLVRNGENELGRFHALWTLEGLNAVNTDLLLETLSKGSDLLKSTALRQLDTLIQSEPELGVRVNQEIERQMTGMSEVFALQVALSSSALSVADRFDLLAEILEKYGNQVLMRDAVMSSLAEVENDFLTFLFARPTWQQANPNQEIFLEMLSMSIVKKSDTNEIQQLLAKVDQPNLGWREVAVLTGLAIQAGDVQSPGMVKLSAEPHLLQRSDLPLDAVKLTMLKRMFSWPGHHPSKQLETAGSLDEKGLRLFAEGRQKFLISCAGCHGNNGKGAARMGPPLAGSEWVLGDEVRLSLILLHGIEGPISVLGKIYDSPEILPVMPSHSTLDDQSIAAILTYIRNEWGNQAPAITGRVVGSTRMLNQGRVYPWSVDELNVHMEKLSAPPKP